MVLSSFNKFYFLAVMIASTILFFVRPTTTFVLDVRVKKENASRRIVQERTRNPFSSVLGAGGFGKVPTGKSSSTKKKKTVRKKRYASSTRGSPIYIPYDSVNDTFDDSDFPRKATQALLDWLDEEEVEGLENVEIGFSKQNVKDWDDDSPGLRGMFAKRDFRVGEYILAVPFVTTLLVDEDFDPSTSDPGTVLLRADEPEVGFKFWKNFFCLDNEGENNDRRKYKPFLDCLPLTPDDPNFDVTPDFWSDDDIRQFEIPSLIEKMLSRKEAITEYAKKWVENEAIDKVSGDDVDIDLASSAISTIQQCCWLVQSRAFTTYKKAMSIDGSVGLLSRVVLIPFIDMINHASRKSANAEMQVIETKEYNESFYALVATKSIRNGSEIKICYGTGEETSLEIFSKYGFWPEVENQEREKRALQKLLKGVEWSTTLEEDQAMLLSKEGKTEPMQTILSTRIYAKSNAV